MAGNADCTVFPAIVVHHRIMGAIYFESFLRAAPHLIISKSPAKGEGVVGRFIFNAYWHCSVYLTSYDPIQFHFFQLPVKHTG